MKAARDSTRRNRNMGTAKRGHGQDNKLTIPMRFVSLEAILFIENLGRFTVVEREIINNRITFLVERTRKDCYHACTVDDITRVIQCVPPDDVRGIDLIVLRQPKRKEELLAPAWGRWTPYVDIGEHHGYAIHLEAMTTSRPFRWSKSLSPDSQAELKRLQQDGHEVTTTKRHHVISSTLDAVRATQLYRTLLHEIGHHVDYKRSPEQFDKRCSQEKEAFAHNYAGGLRSKLIEWRQIPFNRILDAESLMQDKLLLSDFALVDSLSHQP